MEALEEIAETEHDPCTTIFCFCNFLKSFHQTVRDSHARKSFFSSVGARHRVPSQTGDKAKVNTKFVLTPIHSWCTFMTQNFHQIRSACTSPHCVGFKNFRTVGYT